MKIDWTKPVQTRDGRKVRVLCTDKRGEGETLVGLVEFKDGHEEIYSWFADGGWSDGTSNLDLVNVPEPRKTGGLYVNVYRDKANSGKVHSSRASADSCASSGRIACIRIGEWEEGRFDV